MSIRIARIAPGSAAYEGELDLRYRVLRAPLGMARGTEVGPRERRRATLVALDGEAVVGCVVLAPTAGGGS